jgi:hypothetical protein
MASLKSWRNSVPISGFRAVSRIPAQREKIKKK